MTIPVERPKIVSNDIDPQWLAGFTTGEGSFVIRIEDNSTNKGGFQVRLRFNITQHSRDSELMNKIAVYFKCGSSYINRETISYNVYSNKTNIDIIAPFFTKYPVKGYKSIQFDH